MKAIVPRRLLFGFSPVDFGLASSEFSFCEIVSHLPDARCAPRLAMLFSLHFLFFCSTIPDHLGSTGPFLSVVTVHLSLSLPFFVVGEVPSAPIRADPPPTRRTDWEGCPLGPRVLLERAISFYFSVRDFEPRFGIVLLIAH